MLYFIILLWTPNYFLLFKIAILDLVPTHFFYSAVFYSIISALFSSKKTVSAMT